MHAELVCCGDAALAKRQVLDQGAHGQTEHTLKAQVSTTSASHVLGRLDERASNCRIQKEKKFLKQQIKDELSLSSCYFKLTRYHRVTRVNYYL